MHSSWCPFRAKFGANLELWTDLRLEARHLSSWDMILGAHTQLKIEIKLHVSVHRLLFVPSLFDHGSDS
jgi:hypothetical protein